MATPRQLELEPRQVGLRAHEAPPPVEAIPKVMVLPSGEYFAAFCTMMRIDCLSIATSPVTR